jgi:PASTA domain-containing protein
MRLRGPKWVKGAIFFGALVGGSFLIGIALVQLEPSDTDGVGQGLTSSSSSPRPPTVPNIVGLVARRAKSDVNGAGFEPKILRDWSPRKRGVVIRQKPRADATAGSGATVTLVVSKGLPTVPRWLTSNYLGVGLTPLRSAKRKLAAVDLKLGRLVYEVSPRFWLHNGEVFNSSPEPGTSVHPGTRVTLYVTKLAACTPGYSPCLPPHTVLGSPADYDCAGGTGDGPYYVYGTVRVTGDDPYDLDRDNNGWGC